MNTYSRLYLDCPSANAELLSDMLAELGALSVELTGDTWIIEPHPGDQPLWSTVTLVAYFQTEREATEAWQQMLVFFPELTLTKIDSLLDQDWVSASQAQFPPVCIAEKLWIYPAWVAVPEAHTPILRLTPGQAFGTGSHPTTAMCLEMLAEWVVPGMTVLDVGCGSGILALGALALGADQVVATDIDPQAVATTLQNAAQNDYQPGEKLWVGLLEDMPARKADILVANILLEPLMSLRELLLDHIRPGGRLIFSGVLATQAALLQQHYAPLVLEIVMKQEEWVCLSGVC